MHYVYMYVVANSTTKQGNLPAKLSALKGKRNK